MAIQLQFFAWWRPELMSTVNANAVAGRLRGQLTLSASDIDDSGDRESRTLDFDLLGPGDVAGLSPRALSRTFPSRGTRQAEHDKAVYAELAAPDLPWRYTVDRPSGTLLNPWLVLLVGTEDELRVTGTVVTVQAAVLDRYPPTSWPAGVHVEQDVTNPGHPPIARLVSYHALDPDSDQVAVVVPAFNADGTPRWTSPAAAMELPAYYSWTFHTKAGGDFAVLARRLAPHQADPALGSALLDYGPLPNAEPMHVGGALVAAAHTGGGASVPPEVTADVQMLTAALGDEAHPVVGLPAYDEPWPPDDAAAVDSGWRNEMRSDPRRRGIAGLGADAGIQYQERLAAVAARAAGAYQEAAERLRRLRYAMLTSASLWQRRMPQDGTRRLAVLGPALRGLRTAAGSVTEGLEQAGRPLGQALFSTAAKRAWRVSAASVADDTDSSTRGEIHSEILTAAAKPPAAPGRAATAIAHTDALAKSLQAPALDDVVAKKKRPPALRGLRTHVNTLDRAFDRTGFDPDSIRALTAGLRAVNGTLGSGRATAILPLLELIDAGEGKPASRTELRRRIAALDSAPDADDLAMLGRTLTATPQRSAPAPVDLATVASSVSAVFDPTVASPALVDRVVDGIRGLGDDPLEPPELEPELGLAAWQFLHDQAPEWLLPGAAELPADAVFALATNPAFIDAFLLGLNAQVLAELRFRNLPILPGWTPIRTFWERTNPATGSTDPDIVDIETWTPDSAFGAQQHQSLSAATADLVLFFSTPLFREYPGTVVYLTPAPVDNAAAPDWQGKPEFNAAVFPSFQGQLEPDQVFFGFDVDPVLLSGMWVVLEETVRGRRFSNSGNLDPQTGDGAARAGSAIVKSHRVLIRGERLLPGDAR